MTAPLTARSLEAMVERAVAGVDPARLSRARSEFHARTGPFEPSDACHEERIRAFLEWLLVEWEGGAELRRFVAFGGESDERSLAQAALRSMRSLYRVESEEHGEARIECLLEGARFVVPASFGPASRLTAGDVLDARVVGIEGRTALMPGPIFHPREVHEALLAVIAEAREAGRAREGLLDPLARMRMRFDRFTSINARHVYRYDALDRVEILAASWAR